MNRVYNDARTNDNKPKLTITKAINKFLLVWNIKIGSKVPVYYAWDTERQPKWNMDSMKPLHSYLTVDYDHKKREWYIGYIKSVDDRKFCTIDDITGMTSKIKI